MTRRLNRLEEKVEDLVSAVDDLTNLVSQTAVLAIETSAAQTGDVVPEEAIEAAGNVVQDDEVEGAEAGAWYLGDVQGVTGYGPTAKAALSEVLFLADEMGLLEGSVILIETGFAVDDFEATLTSVL